MKKLSILIVILSVLVLTACGQSGDKAGNAGDEKVIKVGATADGYPQYYKEDGEMKGFNIDVFEAVFKEAGYEVEWYVQEWSGVLAAMETGKIDTIANFAVTPERQEKYNYTDPFYYAATAIGISEENNTIKSLEDLKGKKGRKCAWNKL